MDRDSFSIRALGLMLLGFSLVGVVGMAVVGVIQPGTIRGLLRFLSLIIISAGAALGTLWGAVATGMAIQWRVQESD